MEEISFEEFKEQDGNPMAAVAAEEVRYYSGENELGLIVDYEDVDGIGARILRPSPYFDGQCRIDECTTFSGGNAEEKAEDWLKN